jgi:hypothetical protein
MGRQLFQDGPYIDSPLAGQTALTLNTIEPLWVAATYTPIYANDAKAGKIYVVKAGGIITRDATTATGIITPFWNAIALGPSAAQTLPVSMTNVPWTLEAELIFRTIGAAGNTSTCMMFGKWCMAGTLATAGAGTVIPFGSTAASVDATINASLQFNKTWSAGVNSIATHYCYIFARN